MIALAAALLLHGALQDGAFEPIAGPATLCMKYSSFQLHAEERVTGAGMGIEGMELTIESPRGSYAIRESEILAEPRRMHPFLTRDDARILRVDARNYVFYGAVPFVIREEPVGEPTEHLYVWISGKPLGTAKRESILSRLKLGIPRPDGCTRRFQYGWEYMLPEEQ